VSFDWDHFLPVADELLEAAPDEFAEARWRSAASRAYYAAFGGCIDLLARRDQAIDAGDVGVHERVIHGFARHPSRGWQAIGRRLRYLRRTRIHADYRRATAFSEERAREAVLAAHRLLADLQRI